MFRIKVKRVNLNRVKIAIYFNKVCSFSQRSKATFENLIFASFFPSKFNREENFFELKTEIWNA